MINTNRIQSGFDAELLLGGQWFLTAINTLNDNGLLDLPPGAEVTDVAVIMDPDWDLEITISGVFAVRAELEILGGQFIFTTDFNNASFAIDLPNFGQLAQAPVLHKVAGDDDHENAMVLLLNLALRVSAQNVDPLPNNEHVERGNANDALSFLPEGQHIALGIGKDSFQRFANNIWHTSLRASDGSHPLPDEEDKKGDWKRVKVSLNGNKVKFTIEGEVPIDIWPDADVELEVELIPKLENGKLIFAIDLDLDIDTGFWGDVLAFTIGAVVGFVIALFTGGFGLIPAIGLGAVIILELGEYIAGEVIERKLIAKDENGIAFAQMVNQDGIVQFALPQPPEETLSVGFLDAIPSSIPVFIDETDPLYRAWHVVQADFDDISMNENGLAVAGKSLPAELFEPVPATLTGSTYEQDTLKTLTYKILSDDEEVSLDFSEVLSRLGEGELQPPVKIDSADGDPVIQLPAGKLCCPCLLPTQIQRKDSIITRIQFADGLELNTPDAVALQDAAGVLLLGLQFIHPEGGNPYFRAPANETTEDNFESLPEF